MTAREVTATSVLRHRIDAHGLSDQSPGPPTVLSVGVRDNPVGATAPLALRARGLDAADDELVCAYSIRSALHVHRLDDLRRLRAALRWDVGDEPAEQTYGSVVSEDGGELHEIVDHVVRAMRDTMSDATPRTKGELSTEVTGRVDPGEAPWCPSCEVRHVNDALFRYATLLAGLVAVAGQGRSFRLHRIDDEEAEPDPDTARSELLRRYVHLCGVTTSTQFAAWVGMRPQAVERWWSLLESELVPVKVDGSTLAALGDDLASLTRSESGGPDDLHLLPPYDPYTELADRKKLVPDAARRRSVWRAVRNPGVMLRGGEVIGVWRHRKQGNRRSVTLESFEPLTAQHKRALADAAETLLHPTPVNLTFA